MRHDAAHSLRRPVGLGTIAAIIVGIAFVVAGVVKLADGPAWPKQAADMGIPGPGPASCRTSRWRSVSRSPCSWRSRGPQSPPRAPARLHRRHRCPSPRRLQAALRLLRVTLDAPARRVPCRPQHRPPGPRDHGCRWGVIAGPDRSRRAILPPASTRSSPPDLRGAFVPHGGLLCACTFVQRANGSGTDRGEFGYEPNGQTIGGPRVTAVDAPSAFFAPAPVGLTFAGVTGAPAAGAVNMVGPPPTRCWARVHPSVGVRWRPVRETAERAPDSPSGGSRRAALKAGVGVCGVSSPGPAR